LSVPVFFDTNVLIYPASTGPKAEKRQRATELRRRDDGALSIQVLQEFYTRLWR
jgi:predicted nucleic acid-binding protein